MTVLSTIPNGALNKDIRDTINALLADVAALKAGAGTVTPTPAPSFTTPTTISSDGTPQVGEQLTGADGTVANGSITARQWLLAGTAISGATGNLYTPTQTGDHTYRVTALGTNGSTITSSATATVAAATVTPTPTPGSITIDDAVTRSGQQFTFTARRSANLTQAETRSLKLAPSSSYSPAATEAELAGLTATASFAANSATAPAVFTVPVTVQPE